jgi:hypothetical protein
VAYLGSKMLGNDLDRETMDVQKGFWGLEGFDPSKCGAIEARVPLGTWATC